MRPAAFRSKISSSNNTSGFTIVELLIVIVVIAILAAITIVAYSGIRERAHDTTNDSNVTNILKIAETHRASEGSYPELTWNWIGHNEDGSDRYFTRFNTPLSNASDTVYRNPAAPEWAGSMLVLNVNIALNSEEKRFDTWSESIARTINVPTTYPDKYGSWQDFMAAADAALMDWTQQHPLPDMDAPPHVLDEYAADFVAANPDFTCLVYDTCREAGENPETVTEQVEIKKEWMYFLDPLVDESDASRSLCTNYSFDLPTITGYQIRYYSQTKGEWLTKKTGRGISPAFIGACAL